MRPTARFFVTATGTCVAIIILSQLALLSGPVPVGWRDVIKALGGTNPDAVQDVVIYSLRLPRFLIGLVAGASLGLAGALLQISLDNEIADPGILGIANGASLAIVIGLALGQANHAATFAMIGGLATGALVLAASRLSRDPVRTVLIGASLSAFLGACVTLLSVISNPSALQSIMVYLTGSLGNAGFQEFRNTLPWFLASCGIAALCAKPLAALRLGDAMATGLGVPVLTARGAAMAMSIALVIPVTAYCGPIGLVALIAAHLARGMVRSTNVTLVLPLSALLGAALLVSADTAGRILMPSRELPVGLLTTIFGVPYALYLLALTGREHDG